MDDEIEMDDFYEASGDFDSPARRSKPKWAMAKRGDVEVKSVSPAEVRARAQAIDLDTAGETVLGLLFDYRAMYGIDLMQMVYRGRSAGAMAKLGYTLFAKLRRQGFIEKIVMPDKRAVYVLGDVGRAWLRWTKRLRYEPNDQVAILGSRGSKVQHDALIGKFCVPLQLEMEMLGGDMSWTNRSKPDPEGYKRVMWDSYIDIGLFDWSRHAFLEIDRGTESQQQFYEKAYRYSEYYNSGEWRQALNHKRFPDVWVVTSGGEGRLAGMKESVTYANEKLPNSIPWAFTSFERLGYAGHACPLACRVWDDLAGELHYASLFTHTNRLKAVANDWQELTTRMNASTITTERQSLQTEANRLAEIHKLLQQRALKLILLTSFQSGEGPLL